MEDLLVRVWVDYKRARLCYSSMRYSRLVVTLMLRRQLYDIPCHFMPWKAALQKGAEEVSYG